MQLLNTSVMNLQQHGWHGFGHEYMQQVLVSSIIVLRDKQWINKLALPTHLLAHFAAKQISPVLLLILKLCAQPEMNCQLFACMGV